MAQIKVYDAVNKPSNLEKKEIIDFLYTNLQEYGDPKVDIEKAMDYATKEFISFGGFIMLINENGIIKGVTVINQTGMTGYIPENILVYIATDKSSRGKGYGKQLLNAAIKHAKGDIALHVDANNPAIKLYEKLGFTKPYLEMRLKKSK